MSSNNHINYIEFKAQDLEAAKLFYSKAFGWSFTDYGPTYASFSDSGMDGGIEKTDGEIANGVLVVLYNSDLEETKKRVLENDWNISKDIFTFPGGRRYHFLDPSGNELAVWCE